MTIQEHISRIRARGFKYKKDKEIALRSLEAWEKVKAEIENKILCKNASNYDLGLCRALEIIDKNLQEVITDADSD